MTLWINDAERPEMVGETVLQLVRLHTGLELLPNGNREDGKRLGVAVARNSEVVPRSLWERTALAEGDRLEIMTAVQGG